jgi:hypothetical protein
MKLRGHFLGGPAECRQTAMDSDIIAISRGNYIAKTDVMTGVNAINGKGAAFFGGFPSGFLPSIGNRKDCANLSERSGKCRMGIRMGQFANHAGFQMYPAVHFNQLNCHTILLSSRDVLDDPNSTSGLKSIAYNVPTNDWVAVRRILLVIPIVGKTCIEEIKSRPISAEIE